MIMIEELIKGKNVLEIGGPSRLLGGLYPQMLTVSFMNLPESMAVHLQDANPINTRYIYNGDASEPYPFVYNRILISSILLCQNI